MNPLNSRTTLIFDGGVNATFELVQSLRQGMSVNVVAVIPTVPTEDATAEQVIASLQAVALLPVFETITIEYPTIDIGCYNAYAIPHSHLEAVVNAVATGTLLLDAFNAPDDGSAMVLESTLSVPITVRTPSGQRIQVLSAIANQTLQNGLLGYAVAAGCDECIEYPTVRTVPVHAGYLNERYVTLNAMVPAAAALAKAIDVARGFDEFFITPKKVAIARNTKRRP